jgi:hypothetical protein
VSAASAARSAYRSASRNRFDEHRRHTPRESASISSAATTKLVIDTCPLDSGLSKVQHFVMQRMPGPRDLTHCDAFGHNQAHD